MSVPEGDAREIAVAVVENTFAEYGETVADAFRRTITAALLSAESRARPQWRPIETARPDEVGLFWLELADDVAPLNPNYNWNHFGGQVFKGRRGSWSSINKATYWQPLPAAPSSPEEG